MEQRRLFSRLTAGAALGLIHAYRAVTRSGVFPLAGRCRFTPTCSEYCQEAIAVHGPWRGLALGLRRLLSCHPFSSRFGYDPVTKP